MGPIDELAKADIIFANLCLGSQKSSLQCNLQHLLLSVKDGCRCLSLYDFALTWQLSNACPLHRISQAALQSGSLVMNSTGLESGGDRYPTTWNPEGARLSAWVANRQIPPS